MSFISAMLGTAKSRPGTERLQVSFCLLQPTERLFFLMFAFLVGLLVIQKPGSGSN